MSKINKRTIIMVAIAICLLIIVCVVCLLVFGDRSSYNDYVDNDFIDDSVGGMYEPEITNNKTFTNNDKAIEEIPGYYLNIFYETFPDESIDWNSCTFEYYNNDTHSIVCSINGKEQELQYSEEENMYYTIFVMSEVTE